MRNIILGLYSRFYREEAENATELETDGVSGASSGVSRGADALMVQGNRINRSIRTFADA